MLKNGWGVKWILVMEGIESIEKFDNVLGATTLLLPRRLAQLSEVVETATSKGGRYGKVSEDHPVLVVR
jgi:hypothetical protein